MRTIFTLEDVKNIVTNIFNGNLSQHRATNGEIPYKNPNGEKITRIDEESGEVIDDIDIAQYLNINFYNWKQRVVESSDDRELPNQRLSVFDDWVESLNFSLNKSYALVELVDEEVVASQDIDSSTISGRITFLIQSDKIKNLEYYVTKLRNIYLGQPQDIQNSYGEIIKAYIMIGSLIYEQEPLVTQFGECMVVVSNFKISYLGDAQTYNDTKIEISLSGDDLYDDKGNIVDVLGNKINKTKYKEMPITKYTWQNITTLQPQPMVERPDLTGNIATAVSCVKTLSFYDFNKPLTQEFNELFWSSSCIIKNGKTSKVREINKPVYIRVTNGGNFYVYRDVIENMQKVITNNDFNICSITLRGLSKNVYSDTLSLDIVFDTSNSVGEIPNQTLYQGEVLEIPIGGISHPNGGYYLTGFYISKINENGEEVRSDEFVVGREITFDWLYQLYETYGSNNQLVFKPVWVAGTIGTSVVRADDVEILSSNKPITNNGDGTFTMEMYTKLYVSTSSLCSIEDGLNYENFTDNRDNNGSPKDKRYVIITGPTATLSVLCYVPY